MKIAIRKIGNSQGVVIPKPFLAQAGLETEAEITVEGEAVVLRKPARPARSGWAEAAKRLAEFGNEADAEHDW
jgi:antitoxin MazE